MPRLMDIGMDKLTSLLVEMGQLSEQAVGTAIEAYQTGKNLEEVNRLSNRLRLLDNQVSELCIDLIARFQPLASDLRYIKSGIEISYGFYRYGRYAHDIAEVLETFGDLSGCDQGAILRAAEKTKEMIRMSVEGFTKKDVALARRIREMDDYVDGTYRDYVKTVLKTKTVDLKCAMSATLILRYLERIADHATYIGDSVVYTVTGEEPPAV